MPRGRPHRLPLVAYRDEQDCFLITTCVDERRRVFEDTSLALAAVDVLTERALKTGVKVHAYCVMPDHVHLLLAASKSCGVIDFVGAFKSLVARRSWSLGYQGSFWQTSFHDHCMRRIEGYWNTVFYVLENPVEENLVDDWRNYQFSGSLLWPQLRDRE